MSRLRRRAGALLTIVAVTAGCGGGDDVRPSGMNEGLSPVATDAVEVQAPRAKSCDDVVEVVELQASLDEELLPVEERAGSDEDADALGVESFFTCRWEPASEGPRIRLAVYDVEGDPLEWAASAAVVAKDSTVIAQGGSAIVISATDPEDRALVARAIDANETVEIAVQNADDPDWGGAQEFWLSIPPQEFGSYLFDAEARRLFTTYGFDRASVGYFDGEVDPELARQRGMAYSVGAMPFGGISFVGDYGYSPLEYSTPYGFRPDEVVYSASAGGLLSWYRVPAPSWDTRLDLAGAAQGPGDDQWTPPDVPGASPRGPAAITVLDDQTAQIADLDPERAARDPEVMRRLIREFVDHRAYRFEIAESFSYGSSNASQVVGSGIRLNEDSFEAVHLIRYDTEELAEAVRRVVADAPPDWATLLRSVDVDGNLVTIVTTLSTAEECLIGLDDDTIDDCPSGGWAGPLTMGELQLLGAAAD